MVDFPWDQYAPLQAELRDNHAVGNRSWGVEAALNRMLYGNAPANDDDIQRVISSEHRRERHRAALRRLYLVKQEASPDPDGFLQAQIELKSVRAKVSGSDWNLLCAVGMGRGYAEIAAANGGTAGTLRVRVSRLRRDIR